MRIFILALAATLLALPAFADSDLDCAVITHEIDPTEAGATDNYIDLSDGSTSASLTAQDEWLAPRPMKAWGLYVDVDTAPSVNDEWTVSLYKDGVVTGLACTITGTATSCSDTDFGSVVTVATGEDLVVLVDSDTGAADPDAASSLRVSLCTSLDR